jgi:serine/threonine protein kinase
MATPKEDGPVCYYFDDVVVDRDNFRVLKAGQVRTLEPRAFDVLTHLIANRGRVVEKQELFEQVWKQAFVTDNALTRAVKEIRRVIGDDATSPRYIETIPKRGYRFIAEVRTSDGDEAVTVELSPRRPEDVVAALNYRIRGKLGQGGGGVVYLAEDTRLERTVVLKFLTEELVADEVARRRFLREARLASSLDHPNICTIYEINETGGLHFIVMQYAEGETLKQFINGRPLDTDAALAIAVQITDAIRSAHEQGIVHRDIKPGNIVITRKGQVKVLDFGLAKPIASPAGRTAREATELTRQGAQLGTPAYMSPEQARGLAVDHRSDIFSLGVVLYEMVTGRSPFKGRNKTPVDVMYSVLHDHPRSVSDINERVGDELRAIIERAMEKDPARRYQTAAELLEDLRRLKQDSLSAIESEVARKSSWGRRPLFSVASKPVSRRAAIAAVVALVAVATSVWIYWRVANLRWASRQIPRIEEMAQAENYFEAYALALRAQEYLPGDPDLARLMPVISDSFSVTTEPAGASVYLKRFSSDRAAPRELIGTTPFDNRRIARGQYILSIEKEGFAPVERTISSALQRVGTTLQPPSYALSRWVNEIVPIEEASVINEKLVEAGKVPARMVFIPGGRYRLISWARPTEAVVALGD